MIFCVFKEKPTNKMCLLISILCNVCKISRSI